MRKGSTQSPEARLKMSIAHKKRGTVPPSRLGVPNTPEAKAKISATLKAMGHRPKPQYGESNPAKRKDVREKISKALSREKNYQWKGDDVGYGALHRWVEKELGKPSECSHCKITENKVYHWANISGEYKRDVTDWVRLCPPCHSKYDNIPQKAWATRRDNQHAS